MCNDVKMPPARPGKYFQRFEYLHDFVSVCMRRLIKDQLFKGYIN